MALPATEWLLVQHGVCCRKSENQCLTEFRTGLWQPSPQWSQWPSPSLGGGFRELESCGARCEGNCFISTFHLGARLQSRSREAISSNCSSRNLLQVRAIGHRLELRVLKPMFQPFNVGVSGNEGFPPRLLVIRNPKCILARTFGSSHVLTRVS